jgi:hypothetical protein
VSCTSTRNCLAVGIYDTKSHANAALALRWNGTKWSVTGVPVPGRSTSNELFSADCLRATDCWAVGNSGEATLTDRWNGSKWSLVSSPSPNPGRPSLLNGVACDNANECWAVGYTFPGADSGSLTEKWNGDAWRVVSTPSSKSGELVADNCPSPTACLAVGIRNNFLVLAQRWTGHAWVNTPSPKPSGATSAQLSAVACPTASDCLAVGQYFAQSKSLVLAQRWTGTKWVTATAASPAGASVATLNGVTCLSASSCWAVGRTEKGTATNALVEHWNGKGWSVS